MIDELNQAVETYQQKWQLLVEKCANKPFFEQLTPTAVAWKVADRGEYDRLCAELHDQADHIIETWMNGRWIAKVLLRDTKLVNGVTIIKIMQRRPGSTDAVGLDHIDFYSPEVAHAEHILQQEADLKWTRENNDIIEGYEWLSIWFDGTEAKLKSNTVLDIISVELQQLNAKITKAAS